MLFVKCESPPSYGRFSKGSIYVAHDDLEGEAASRSSFHLTDDAGARVGAKFEGGNFVEMEQVYVCCIKPCGSFQPGEIVAATGVDETSFKIEGFGWFNSSCFEILDQANWFVGLYVWDEPSDEWADIKEVREDQSVRVDGRPEFRAPNDFGLCIEDGNIEVCPKALSDKGL